MHTYTSCLHIYDEVVGKHITEDGPTDLQIDTAIPFTINIFEKVFPSLDKAEIDDEVSPRPKRRKGDGQSDRDEEDGK